MDKFVDIISERKIREAVERGELKNLPGAGKPVTIENFYFLPPEFKFAYTVLKNGGYLDLANDEESQVSLNSTKDLLNEHSPNFTKAENSLVDDEGKSSNAKPINMSEYIQEKAQSFTIIRDCRRRR